MLRHEASNTLFQEWRVLFHKNDNYLSLQFDLILLKHFYILFFVCFVSTAAYSQRFSIATDVSLLRNFKETQKSWAIGQTVHAHFHFTPKDGVYFWISFYMPAKFKNNLTATAKSAATQPQKIGFVSNSSVNFKNLSVGWKRYLKGFAYSEESWSLYGYAGFGLLLARIQNNYSVFIDTSKYNNSLNPLSGQGRFRRLTLDAGIGGEIPIGGELFYLPGRKNVDSHH